MALPVARSFLCVLVLVAASTPGFSRKDGEVLREGEQAKITLSATNNDGSLWMGLCGGRTGCIRAQIEGVSEDQVMHYWSGISYGKNVSTGFAEWGSTFALGPNKARFTPGKNYTFVVHRRSHTWMAIWLDSNPDGRFALHLPIAQSNLQVFSSAGPVRYIDE